MYGAFSATAAMHRGLDVDLDAGLAMEAASVGLKEGLSFANSAICTIRNKVPVTLRPHLWSLPLEPKRLKRQMPTNQAETTIPQAVPQ